MISVSSESSSICACSGSRPAISSSEPSRSTNITVTSLRSPSMAPREARMRCARCAGVSAAADGRGRRTPGSTRVRGRAQPPQKRTPASLANPHAEQRVRSAFISPLPPAKNAPILAAGRAERGFLPELPGPLERAGIGRGRAAAFLVAQELDRSLDLRCLELQPPIHLAIAAPEYPPRPPPAHPAHP